jgi:RNA polymerase sigma-70 factor, ECF subfamily
MIRLRTRDEAALHELYTRLSAPVFALVLRLLESREEAEEVLQDTFVRIFEKALSYRPEFGSPRAFVYTIARNEALSRLRVRSSRPQSHPEWDLYAPDVALSSPEVDSLEKAMLTSALGQLSEIERGLLEQSFFAGMSHGEIAQSRSQPLGTIKSRLKRALTRLKIILGGA